MTKHSRKILITGPAWVGDMVMAQSLFITLKKHDPEVHIDVLAPEWSIPLLKRMPEIAQGITLPLGHGDLGLGIRWKIGRELRKAHYDQAIILPRSMKSALIPFFSRARIRTGYLGEMRYGILNDIRPLDKHILTQTVQRHVTLGLPRTATLPPEIPRPKLTVNIENQQRLIDHFKLDNKTPTIALMPGAEYGPAKRWPEEHYAELTGMLMNEGFQVLIFGSEKEAPLADKIISLSGKEALNLCGKTRLEDAIDLIASCNAAVSNDSGLMHIAAAVNCPIVAIYGSSTPDYTPPLSENASIIYHRLDCSPCFKRECPLGHTDCLHGINAEEVYETLNPVILRSKT